MIFNPKPYQATASSFLQERDEAALFTGVGLGKTASTLHALTEVAFDGACRGVLVVAPLRVCNITWPNEAEKWENFGWMSVANLRTKEGQEKLRKRSAFLYLCNYEMLPKLAEIKNPPWDRVVFDELTRAKNHSSTRINAFRKHALGLRARWGLTGTPTPNSYLELFAQVRLLDGGKRLGKSFSGFRDAWFTKADYFGYSWKIRPGAAEGIMGRIADLALVQRTSDYLNAPDMIAEDVPVTMPEEARKAYDKLEEESLLVLDQGQVTAVNAAVLVGKLLQAAGGALYDDERLVRNLHHEKIIALQALAKKLKEPILIACNYRHEQERIVAAIPGCARFEAGLSGAKQNELVAKWNARKLPALVADPRSIGHGLNLQEGGRHVVWYSRPHSRELYDQFNARLYRTGQTEQVYLWHINCAGTVDDSVAETLRTRDEDQKTLLQILLNLKKLKAA